MATEIEASSRSNKAVYQDEIVRSAPARYALAAGRFVIGWVFFWAFIDKLFGLGYSTATENAWLNGGSPAQGYIAGMEGPFADFFQSVFQNPFGDWLFMLGLAGIGIAMIPDAGLKVAAVPGTVLMALICMSHLPFVLGGANPTPTSHWHAALI